jgi:DNA replicative helicase MCM subunit Mcm2 (Cdc46/Mcm family)
LCVRCGKTIIIDHFHSRKVENFEEARRVLGELNSKIGTETENRIKSERITAKSNVRTGDDSKQSRKGLLRTFREDVLPRFIDREVQLSEILDECEKFGVTRDYAEKLLKELTDSGQAYQPRKDWIKLL